MIIIADKNKELIKRVKEVVKDCDFIVAECGDIFKIAKKYKAKIATASNPDFDFAGGLDYQIAQRFPEEIKRATEFSYTDNLFFTLSVDSNRNANYSIVMRAMAGIYAYHRRFDIVVSGLGTGIGGLSIGDFTKIVANLSSANLRSADLRSADLRSADLSSTNLSSANLSYADLRYADLSYANLSSADLSYANLSSANLENVYHNESTAFYSMQCPSVGSFIGWKKCRGGVIIKLMIPARAKRSSATTRKCRAEYVKTLAVYGADIGVSSHDGKTKYEVGKITKCDNWDDNRWNECSGGIHFFITREEAEQWNG